jgi:hypothetical protein
LEYWAHRNDATTRDPRPMRADGHADREVSAERLTDDEKSFGRMARVNVLDCVDDFVDATGMEEILVERLSISVVTKIEPEHRVARFEKPGTY